MKNLLTYLKGLTTTAKIRNITYEVIFSTISKVNAIKYLFIFGKIIP